MHNVRHIELYIILAGSESVKSWLLHSSVEFSVILESVCRVLRFFRANFFTPQDLKNIIAANCCYFSDAVFQV